MLVFHRKEQFDIVRGGIAKPILVIGWKTPDTYSRLFCLWSGGVWLRLRGNKRFCRVWARPAEQRNEAVDAGQDCPLCHGTGYKSISPTILAECKHNATGQS